MAAVPVPKSFCTSSRTMRSIKSANIGGPSGEKVKTIAVKIIYFSLIVNLFAGHWSY